MAGTTPGPLAPGQRWSVARKREVALRLMRGESTELLSRELGLPVFRLEQWRRKAEAGLEAALKEREADPAEGQLAAALQRIGELSMEGELLRAKMERAGPCMGLPKFGFGHLCGVAKRMDDAVAEGGAEFRRLACVPGREETLLAPELAPNRGERVGEGGPLLAVPSGGRGLEPGVAAEAGGEEGDDGGKGGQGGGGEGAGVGLPPPPGPR